eukprot:COSAG02_NODE_1799_length_10896_cov_8.648421_12_plen_176_part_00
MQRACGGRAAGVQRAYSRCAAGAQGRAAGVQGACGAARGSMDRHNVTELEARINPEEVARRLLGEDTIEEYDATSNTDSSDSDFVPDGAGDDPPQAIVVRDRLRTTEELDKAKLHDDAQPFAQSKHSGRGKVAKKIVAEKVLTFADAMPNCGIWIEDEHAFDPSEVDGSNLDCME